MINKTHPSCTKIKVQVDLATNLPAYTELEVVNNKTDEINMQNVKIQYDTMPKYCHTCKLQVRDGSKYRSLHHGLRRSVEEEKVDDEVNKKEYNEEPVQRRYINRKVVLAKCNDPNLVISPFTCFDHFISLLPFHSCVI